MCHTHAWEPTFLAIHSLWSACRLAPKVGRSECGALALGLMLANSYWSLLGAIYWLQPGGYKFPGFETVWRLSAMGQVVLLHNAYRLGLLYNRLGGLFPFISRHERLLARLALLHAVLFGLSCLSSHTCLQNECTRTTARLAVHSSCCSRLLSSSLLLLACPDVLWGGVNILPPLLSQWLLATLMTRRRGLLRRGHWRADPRSAWPHPLVLGTLSGVFYWLGNSGILLGRHTGLALWGRKALAWLCGEMCTL